MTALSNPFDLFLIFIFIFLPLLAALVCLKAMFHFIRRARISEDNPISKIRSAAQGYVELRGKVKTIPNYSLKAKLTGFDCVWYHAIIEEFKNYQTDQGMVTRLEPVEAQKSVTPFLFSDETGECLVFPKEAEIITLHFSRWYGATRYPKPLTEKRSWWSWIFEEVKRYQYTEYYLKNEDAISIAGFFQTLPKETILRHPGDSLDLYLNDTPKHSMDVVSNQNLAAGFPYLISGIPTKKLSTQLRAQAFVAFLAFLFFLSLILTTAYPIIWINLHDWVKQNIYRNARS